MGETWRSTATAKLMEDQKKGIASSLHCQRLAVDLNLFRDGHYLTDGKDYFDAGEIWESYSTDEFECAWGGRFGSKDYNHFSIAHAGIK